MLWLVEASTLSASLEPVLLENVEIRLEYDEYLSKASFNAASSILSLGLSLLEYCIVVAMSTSFSSLARISSNTRLFSSNPSSASLITKLRLHVGVALGVTRSSFVSFVPPPRRFVTVIELRCAAESTFGFQSPCDTERTSRLRTGLPVGCVSCSTGRWLVLQTSGKRGVGVPELSEMLVAVLHSS